MSKTRVKTTYSEEGAYGTTVSVDLYCIHYHTTDNVEFYFEDGTIVPMCFRDWEDGNDLWDAMNRLMFPFKGKYGRSDLKDRVEFFKVAPWDKSNN